MLETRQQITEILDILEGQEAETEEQGMSMDQIKKIFLDGHKAVDTDQEADDLFLRIVHLEESARLNYYHMLPEETSLRMKIANFIKRVTRKLIRPIMLPLADAQTAYNEEIKEIMYRLYDRESILQDEQKALRYLLMAVNKELKENHSADE